MVIGEGGVGRLYAWASEILSLGNEEASDTWQWITHEGCVCFVFCFFFVCHGFFCLWLSFTMGIFGTGDTTLAGKGFDW